jgi:hypothetical protein
VRAKISEKMPNDQLECEGHVELKHFKSTTFDTRTVTEPCRISDIIAFNKTAISQQQDIERYHRALSRDAVAINNALKQLSLDTNTALDTVSATVDTAKAQIDNRITTIKASQDHEIVNLWREVNSAKSRIDDLAAPQIMTLTGDYSMLKVGVYSGLSDTSFDQWARKFKDYIEAMGAAWTEPVKIG